MGVSISGITTRRAELRDVPAVVAIYNQGIEERIATFETRPRVDADIMPSLESRFPIVVVEDAHGAVVAFASTSLYRSRDCYAGIAEFSVYVERSRRRLGLGSVAMEALFEAAERAGFWKLVSRIFIENDASRELCRALGFREVGIYHRHGKLDGVWRDVVIVERLLGDAADK
jgi:phosphinothricin acetyltransferase